MPENSRSLFRVALNGKVIASGLTAAQAHLVVGDALEAFGPGSAANWFHCRRRCL